MSEAIKITPPTPVTTASAVNVIFDSTYGLIGTPSSTVVGPYRGRYGSVRISGFVDVTTNDCTLRLDYLKSDSTWTTGAYSATITAATTKPFDVLAVAADWRLVEVNGNPGPGAVTLSGVQLIKGDRASGS